CGGCGVPVFNFVEEFLNGRQPSISLDVVAGCIQVDLSLHLPQAPQFERNLSHPVFQGTEYMLDNAFALGDAGFSVAAADLAGIAIPPGGPVEDGELTHAIGRAGTVGLQRASLAVGTTISIQVGVFVFAIATFTFRGQDAPGRAAVLVGARLVGKLYVAVGHRGVVFRNITAGVRFGLNLFNVSQIGLAA